ncbi:hypothetical protein NQ315_013660 [Exocentrus adspersus]|uniref:RNase H type-1 domain-containing protein n=1 Tax=Exocentrus adspersus TaxID=1586481 RepID=A0AAV8W3E6_9CUCU|nr:hypothetical protein NQ315_013660 [Exocentrus adspersus]
MESAVDCLVGKGVLRFLESLARQKEVELVWVLGHMGTPGNERADELAGLESEELCQRPEQILIQQLTQFSKQRSLPS